MSENSQMSARVLNETDAYCPDCEMTHAARYEVVGDDVFFCVACPEEGVRALVSANAERFVELRRRSHVDIESAPGKPPFRMVNIVLITNACNFSCNFCYASAVPPEDARFVSLDDMRLLADRLRHEGCYTVSLCGGEPTLHPRLPEIIGIMRRRGILVTLVSNGYRLGTEPDLAKTLKRAGVKTVALQLDTLDPTTHAVFRNNAFVEEQKTAIKRCLAAGLRVMVTVTISKRNIDQLGDIVRYLLQFQPRLHMIAFQPLFDAGHVGDDFGPEQRICREEVIREFSRSAGEWGLQEDHFWPFPAFAPLKVAVHPDCGAIAALCRVGDRFVPFDDLVDVEALCASMAKFRETGAHYLLSVLRLMGLVWRHARRGRRAAVALSLCGLLTGRGRSGIVLLPIEAIMDTKCYDMQRACRCVTALRGADGCSQPGCFTSSREL